MLVVRSIGPILTDALCFVCQVLRFHAYFKEDVENSRIESFRVRKVDMHYYLVDDTLSIEEHREDNSGMEQGSFLSRQKAYHDGTDNQVTPLDLVIGAAIVLFGRTYTIVDADKHVRVELWLHGGLPCGCVASPMLHGPPWLFASDARAAGSAVPHPSCCSPTLLTARIF